MRLCLLSGFVHIKPYILQFLKMRAFLLASNNLKDSEIFGHHLNSREFMIQDFNGNRGLKEQDYFRILQSQIIKKICSIYSSNYSVLY